jgi:hypothetical protein
VNTRPYEFSLLFLVLLFRPLFDGFHNQIFIGWARRSLIFIILPAGSLNPPLFTAVFRNHSESGAVLHGGILLFDAPGMA